VSLTVIAEKFTEQTHHCPRNSGCFAGL